MGKKIIILNGSPRPKGNTVGLIKAFTEGTEKAGHTVTTFLVDRMHIKSCKGCYGGGKNPDSPCVQKDDMEKIYPVFEQADIVVFATPMYYWGMTGQLKTVLDRLFAVSEKYPDFMAPKKDSLMLMAAGGEGQSNNQPVEDYFNALLERLEWNNKGIIIAEGANDPGDIVGHPALDEARRMGESI